MSIISSFQLFDLHKFLELRSPFFKNPHFLVVGVDIEIEFSLNNILSAVKNNTHFIYELHWEDGLVEVLKMRGNFTIRIKSDNAVEDILNNVELKSFMNIGLFIKFENEHERTLITSLFNNIGYKMHNRRIYLEGETLIVDSSPEYMIIRYPHYSYYLNKIKEKLFNMNEVVTNFRTSEDINDEEKTPCAS